MCLGIVGQVVALSEEHPELATVDVAGATARHQHHDAGGARDLSAAIGF